MTKPRFQLLIEAQPDPTDRDGNRRLRLALKRLLRSFGLRCVRVEPIEGPPAPETKEQRCNRILAMAAERGVVRASDLSTTFTAANARRATAIAAADRGRNRQTTATSEQSDAQSYKST